MNKIRRRLLKWVIALPFAGLSATKIGAKETKCLYPLNKFYIACFQYYKGCNLINRLNPNMNLELISEPGNQYDRFAVKILF